MNQDQDRSVQSYSGRSGPQAPFFWMLSLVSPVSPTWRISSSFISRTYSTRRLCSPMVVKSMAPSLSGLSRWRPRISTRYARASANFSSKPLGGLYLLTFSRTSLGVNLLFTIRRTLHGRRSGHMFLARMCPPSRSWMPRKAHALQPLHRSPAKRMAGGLHYLRHHNATSVIKPS